VYPTRYHERAYAGQSPFTDDRCPICGATTECPDSAVVPMPYPPVDIDDSEPAETGPLRRYAVTTAHGYTTVMQLNDGDAARYGDAATLIP
jgi:hypothetical protein